MAYSKAQLRATEKYHATHMERLGIWVRKGDMERLKATAEANSVSVTQFIIKAVNDYSKKQVLTPAKNAKEHWRENDGQE